MHRDVNDGDAVLPDEQGINLDLGQIGDRGAGCGKAQDVGGDAGSRSVAASASNATRTSPGNGAASSLFSPGI